MWRLWKTVWQPRELRPTKAQLLRPAGGAMVSRKSSPARLSTRRLAANQALAKRENQGNLAPVQSGGRFLCAAVITREARQADDLGSESGILIAEKGSNRCRILQEFVAICRNFAGKVVIFVGFSGNISFCLPFGNMLTV